MDNNNLKYDNVDINDIIANLKGNEIKVDNLNKYLNSNVLFDLSNDIWNSEVKDKIIIQINKVQEELNEFSKMIENVVNDLDNAQKIQKYENEIEIIKKENEILSLDESSNQNRITENNDVIESYKEIIISSNKNLEKWR